MMISSTLLIEQGGMSEIDFLPFRVNYLLDRHLQISYMIVDDYYDALPPLRRDVHWKEDAIEVPHTKASFNLKNNPLVGSAANFQ